MHDYCIWRSAQTLRPGGIAVLITSREQQILGLARVLVRHGQCLVDVLADRGLLLGDRQHVRGQLRQAARPVPQAWLKLIRHNDPEHQEKVIKFNELIANCVIYSPALDITDAANELAAEGEPVHPDDLATIAPYITHTVRRFGNWVINLTPPEAPVTRLDLEPRVLFRAAPG